MRRAALAALALVMLPWIAARAQTPDASGFELRKVEDVHLDDVLPGAGGERLVELELRALAHDRVPVEHLRPVDVTVLQDGRAVEPGDVSLQRFDEAGRPLALVLAVDVSRAMSGDPLQQAKTAALGLLDRLGPDDRVALVSISAEPHVVAPFGTPRAELGSRLASLAIDDNSIVTLTWDGVHRALELVREAPDLPRRAVVVVLSDGKDDGSHHPLDEAIALARSDGARPSVLVYAVGYSRFGGRWLDDLQRLGDETGGRYMQAGSDAQLTAFYDGILSEIRSSYLLRFPAAMDGAAHRVEVLVEGHKDARSVRYPLIRPPLWPWLAAGGAGLVVLALGLLLLGRRSAGQLAFVTGARAGDVVTLRSGRIRIGALPDNDVVIHSNLVSRYHAEVRVRGRRVEIEDLRSSNGTLVNGQPVAVSPLRPGDRIRIADVDLLFER